MKLNRFITCIILSAGLTCAAAARDNTLPSPQDPGFIYFTADKAKADPTAKKVSLEGNVTIIQKTKDGAKRTVTGDNITLDQTNTQISSVGPMRVEAAGGVLEGKNISVNYTTHDFIAHDITTQYPPLRVIGAKEISSKNGKETLRNVELTCCNKPDPHYTLSVGKLTVSPQKRVFGTNAVFKLDGFPVLWLPVFWRSLDSQKPWTTYVDFTQSKKIGFGVLTSTVFPEVFHFRPKINLDYYTKSGVGTGIELMAVESPTLKGTGEAYYIDDHSNTKEEDLEDNKRWGVRGGYWWEMADTSDQLNNPGGALYQFQTQFRMVSDPYFNDSFFRGNPYIFMPDQETNFSLSRQTRKSTLRITYQQKDIFDNDKKKFMAEKRSLPEIKYMLLPFKDPLLKTSNYMEVSFDNTSRLEGYNSYFDPDGTKHYSGGEEGPYRHQAHARWTTEKEMRLARSLTFTPAVFYDQTLTFDDKYYEKKDSWVSRLGTDVNFQTNTLLGTTDLSYQYTKRLSTGTLRTDSLSLDRGEERNRIYLNNYFRPTFNTYIRFGTGFNLANTMTDLATGEQRELNWNHLKNRIEPILLEGRYQSDNGQFTIFAQDQYDIAEKNQSFITQLNWFYKQQIIGFGMNNFATHTDPNSLYQTYSNRYTFTTSLGIRPSSGTWLADLGLDFEMQGHRFVGFNKMARVARNFHDARLELTVRDRNENLSFTFRINILCGKDARAQQQRPEDAYWYPWRSEGDLRDL